MEKRQNQSRSREPQKRELGIERERTGCVVSRVRSAENEEREWVLG